MSLLSIRQNCGICGSTALYNAFPSGKQFCSHCGNPADAVPARNQQPRPEDDDVRVKARTPKATPAPASVAVQPKAIRKLAKR